MEPYNSYAYLYPPRPEYTTEPESIKTYDNGEYLAQPKYNGSLAVVFINETGVFPVMNRHKQGMKLVDHSEIDFNGLYKGKGFMILCGELLNKNKVGESGKSFNKKFIIWDILVYNGEYLLGTTIEYRLNLLDQLYPATQSTEKFKHLIPIGVKGAYRAPAYSKNFEGLYKSIIDTPLYEGLVFKRKDALLQRGHQSNNNYGWQVKVRKPTKNYRF